MAEVPTGPELGAYDRIIVAFSGGKDSLACLLHLVDAGVDLTRVELWHHDIDGREGSTLMDWPVTRAYCERVAEAFGLPLYFSWLEGGFEREMLRDDTPKARTFWQEPGGTLGSSGGNGKGGRRLRFPQVSADLSVRWCSAYLKIDVCAAAIRGQERLMGRRVLVVTGERAQESTARARYATFEPDRSDNRNGRPGARRHVDHWRPIHAWTEAKVWEAIARHRILPHVAYRLGWGRTSCQFCIFGSKDQWASARAVDPARFAKIAAYEERFGSTIQRRLSVVELADAGTPYPATADKALVALALGHEHPPVRLAEGEAWVTPPGAFGESCGPT